MNECRVLHYDRGEKGSQRPYKNATAIRQAVNGHPVILDHVERHVDFGSEKGAETRLLSETPYKAVIINADGAHYQDVLAAAMLAMEANSLPYDRIILLQQQPSADLADTGICFVNITGGNGHLTDRDASVVAQLLLELAKNS